MATPETHCVAEGVNDGAVGHAHCGRGATASGRGGSAADGALGRYTAAARAGVVALVLLHASPAVARQQALQEAALL